MTKFEPVENDLAICKLPKHKDEYWSDIIEEDRDYVEWLVSGNGPVVSEELYEYLIELLEQ